MKKLLIIAMVVAIVGLAAVLASAQSVPNPTKANWTASTDHSMITSYEAGWFLPGATSPVSVVDLGKPTPDTVPSCSSPAPCIEATINIMPLGFNEYVAKVRARAGSLYSEWSDPSNPFVRVPGQPGGPVVKK